MSKMAATATAVAVAKVRAVLWASCYSRDLQAAAADTAANSDTTLVTLHSVKRYYGCQRRIGTTSGRRPEKSMKVC